MTYKENPKTKGSGIVCCIPQTGGCPMECHDCFFQSGRGYLDLEKDLPNMPDKVEPWQIVRVNDGNDSNVDPVRVLKATEKYPLRFYNTSMPNNLESFIEPVVLTVNPGHLTDVRFLRPRPIPKNLMFVRVRTNIWNIKNVVEPAVDSYTRDDLPVVLTFMAYHEESMIPENYRYYYVYRKRTSNPYWAIKTAAWEEIMERFRSNPLVYSCGTEGITTACKACGNCAREFMRTKERLNV